MKSEKLTTNASWIGILLLMFAAALNAQVTGSGTINTIPVWINTTTLGNSPIVQKSGNIGIGTKAPTAKLHIVSSNKGPMVVLNNTSTSTTTSPVAVEGLTPAINGTALLGIASTTSNGALAIGVSGQSGADGGNGVQGLATAACATYCPSGVYGITMKGGVGVNATANNTSGSSNAVQAINHSPQGFAVAAANTAGGLVFVGASGSSYTTVFTVDG